MKKIIVFTLLVVFRNGFSQAPTLQWEKTISGNVSSDDYPVKSVMDATGNVYLTGKSAVGVIFVVKYDNNGNELFRTTYTGPGINGAYVKDILVDNNNNIYLAGGASDFNTGLGMNFVAKLSAQGGILWAHNITPSYGGAHYPNYYNSISLDNPSNPTVIYASGAYNDSIIVEKINIQTGAGLWKKMFESGTIKQVRTDNNGNPFICGLTRANFITNGEDGYVARLSASGSLAWRYTFNGLADSSDVANNIIVLASGDAIIAGICRNNAGNKYAGIKEMRLSPSGQPVWNTTAYYPGYTSNVQTNMSCDAQQTAFFITADVVQNCCGGQTGALLIGLNLNGGQSFFNTYFNASATLTTTTDVKTDAYGSVYVLGLATNNTNFRKAYIWKNDQLGNTLGTGLYSTLSPVGSIGYPCNLHLNNAGMPYATFQVYFTGSNHGGDGALAQFNPNCTQNWEVFYDGKDNNADWVSGMTLDKAGNVYLSGTLANVTANSVLAKYNSSGTLLWENINLNIYSGDLGASLISDTLANIYSLRNTNTQANLVKTDSSGNQVWNTQLPGQASVLTFDASGNIHAVGGSNAWPFSGLPNTREFDFAITTNTGSVTASYTFAASAGYITTATSLAIDNNGNTFVLGTVSQVNGSKPSIILQKFNASAQSTWYYKVPGIDSTAIPATAAKVIYNANDGFLYAICSGVPQSNSLSTEYILKINPSTNIVTTYTYNAGTNYVTNDAVISATNDIYITGQSGGGSVAFVQKWNNSGVLQWEKTFFDNFSGNNGQGLTLDNSGNVFMTGNLSSQAVDQNQYTFTAKLTPTGTILWSNGYPGPVVGGNGYGQFIAVNNGRAYVAGSVQTGPYTGVNNDISLLKYCDFASPHLSHSGTVSICANSSYTVSAPAFNSYMWNTGATTPSVTASTTGNYFCTVYQPDGCYKNTDTLHVNLIAAPVTPSICMVTVDSASTHNIIYWNKTPYAGTGALGFKIYREDLTNVYTYIGSVPFANLSEYHDHDAIADPNTTTKRYKLSVVDSCGNESAKSNYHNTIFIISAGNGQFTWNPGYTIENSPNPVNNYVLMRDDYNTGNWHQVAITSGTQNTIADVNYNLWQPTANWHVETVWGISCTPTARQGNQTVQGAVVKSKSNITNNRVSGIGSLTDHTVRLYPNPVKQNLELTVSAQNGTTTVKIRSLLGEELYAASMDKNSTLTIDVSLFATGTYLVELTNNEGRIVKRIVKD